VTFCLRRIHRDWAAAGTAGNKQGKRPPGSEGRSSVQARAGAADCVAGTTAYRLGIIEYSARPLESERILHVAFGTAAEDFELPLSPNVILMPREAGTA